MTDLVRPLARLPVLSLVLAAAVVGCAGGPVPLKAAPTVAAAPASADAGLDAGPTPPFVQVVVAPRWRREDGCARNWAPAGDPSKDVVALGRICAQGTTAVFAQPALIRVAPGRAARVPFALTAAPACLYAAAAADAGGISLSLRDPQDKPLFNLVSTDSAVFAPPDGPVCVRGAGTYQAVVSIPSADASSAEVTIAVQIWRTGSD